MDVLPGQGVAYKSPFGGAHLRQVAPSRAQLVQLGICKLGRLLLRDSCLVHAKPFLF